MRIKGTTTNINIRRNMLEQVYIFKNLESITVEDLKCKKLKKGKDSNVKRGIQFKKEFWGNMC